VLVTNNIDVGKRVPLAVGDDVVVHGEYVWNDEGGLIHFTHHDADRSHEDGWIEWKGVRYGLSCETPVGCAGFEPATSAM
jgi:hypothetical protein